MKTKSLSVTDAARNFADCVNRVRYQNMSFVLLKNGTPVARLVPAEKKVCTGRELARALRRVDLSTEEAVAWSRGMKKTRKGLKPQRDKRR
ncbi:MAG TPA: type II toxin-antitoxin system prevent-host-death family antitoxin [Candidatus Binatus sp.]|nr:type II toxin-antitoxin system prevent-host-death family antitoxin [Candidatus Binatus sp.]